MFKLFNTKRSKKGFTLTELIVVVAILGVLAAIATPIIGAQLQNAKVKADLATAKTYENAVQMSISTGDSGDITVDSATNKIVTTNVISAIKKYVVGATIDTPSQGNSKKYYLNITTYKVEVLTATEVEGKTTPGDYFLLN